MTDVRTHTIRTKLYHAPHERESEAKHGAIVLNDDGHSVRERWFHGQTAYHIGQMLWLDAFENGPWTPSFITKIIVQNPHGTVEYTRAEQ